MPGSVIVLGAGMVGVSVALHLRRRGYDVTVVDRSAPGEGASFGNGGLIQREAVFPHPFPRSFSEVLRVARNRSIDVSYHWADLPRFAGPLLRYWWNSEPSRYAQVVQAYAALIRTCLDEHLAFARGTPAADLLRPVGYMRLYGNPRKLDADLAEVEKAHREHGVNYAQLDADALAAAEPALLVRRIGAIHWTDPLSCTDPHGLVMAYAAMLEAEGGRILRGEAMTLERAGAGWRVQTAEGPVDAGEVVIALGAYAGELTKRFGYRPPLFGKRGYHHHYRMQGNAVLNRPVIDTQNSLVLVPMRAGVRLTTGAEFARNDADPTPVQLARAEPVARTVLPLGERVEQKPWLGVRPCTPDMLPIIGRLPGQEGAWCAFGHAHQGFTLGPTTGRMIAEMMTGALPAIDPTPYRAERFA